MEQVSLHRPAGVLKSGLQGLAVAILLSSSGWAKAAPLVVLDPGHGGHLTGCRSETGYVEKTAVLAIAKAARARLADAGIRVRLTRSGDRHLPLSARPAVANRLDADAFVSIHLNHAQDPERRGWETYVLSAEAKDDLTRRVLALEEGEEAAARGARGPVGGTDLDFILADLSRGVAHAQSARLAKAIQDAAAGISGLTPSRGLRQAPFTVLVGAEVPAVLVEVGYLSNRAQADFFSSTKGHRVAGRAIARGVLAFLKNGRR